MKLEQITGIGPSLLRRIRDRWPSGLDTPALHDNPYLLTEIRGIGFMLADRVARQACGLNANAPQRIDAAGAYVMSQAEMEGHTALPVNEFGPRLLSVLGVGGLKDDPEFDERAIVEYDGMVSRRATDFAENVVAAKFAALVRAKPSIWTRVETNTLKQDQVNALASLCDESIFLLLGGPGVGKTYLIRQIIEGARCSFALTAPTGKAAKRIEELAGEKAQTIHRLLGVIHKDSSEYRGALPAHSHGFKFRHNARRPLDLDLIVVDEASMCDIRLMADLCDAMRPGARLLLVGDPFQLPSVGPGAILRDACAADVPHFELTELKRQNPELLIARNCQSIRYEKKVIVDNRSAADFFFLECSDPKRAQALIVEMVTERLPAKYGFDPMKDIVTITALRDKGELSRKALNLALRPKLNPMAGDNPRPTIGDRVMQLSNNYDLDIMNGDIGTIIETLPPKEKGESIHDLTVLFDTPEREVRAPWDEFDLDFAYALTVHKFQGSEAPAIVLVVHEQQGGLVTSAQWLYTAISRAKEVCVVIGSRGALNAMAERHRDIKRNTRLASLIQKAAD